MLACNDDDSGDDIHHSIDNIDDGDDTIRRIMIEIVMMIDNFHDNHY